MPPELIDTHCHLDREPLAAALDAVLTRARGAGVRSCLCVGITAETSRAAIDLARRHPMLRAAVGVHPHDAEGATDTVLADLEALAGEPEVVAIGEVGLDYYRRLSAPQEQLRVLRGFLVIARRRRLPVVLHCRDAYEPLLECLRQAGGDGALRGVIHCASGPPSFIRAALELGLHISFAGNVTFPNAQALQALVALVPDERLLIETDAPFLAPQPVRGSPNEPAHLAHTAEQVARLRGVSVEAVGRLTSRNARALFGFLEPVAA